MHSLACGLECVPRSMPERSHLDASSRAPLTRCIPALSAGRQWLAEQLQQPQAAEKVTALAPLLLHRLVGALAADSASFAPHLERLAASCPALHSSTAEPALLALLPVPAAASELAQQWQEEKQQIASAADAAADVAENLSMAADGANGAAGGLAPLLEQLGYPATASDAAARKVMSHAGELNPAAVAAALGLMARTREGFTPSRRGESPPELASALGGLSLDGASSAWQPEALVDAVKFRAPGLDWAAVAEALDQPDFNVPDQAALQILMSAFKRAGDGGGGDNSNAFPLPAVLGRMWRNAGGQLSLLRAAASAPPELFSFAGAALKQPPVEGLTNGAPSAGTPNEAWLSLDLFETLARLSTEGGNHAGVRAVLEAGAQAAPEVMLLGFVQSRADWGVLQREVGTLLHFPKANSGCFCNLCYVYLSSNFGTTTCTPVSSLVSGLRVNA